MITIPRSGFSGSLAKIGQMLSQANQGLSGQLQSSLGGININVPGGKGTGGNTFVTINARDRASAAFALAYVDSLRTKQLGSEMGRG